MAGFEREAERDRLARIVKSQRPSGPGLRTRVGAWLIRVGQGLSADRGSLDRAVGPIASVGAERTESTEPRLSAVRREAVRLRPDR